MSRDDDDRPKKSWREIDKQRDRSKHRKEDRPVGSPRSRVRAEVASRIYRTKLDSFFEGGDVPAYAREQARALEPSSPEARERTEALAAIRAIATTADADRLIGAFVARFDLPPDHDVLVQALLCSDESLVRRALSAIDGLLKERRPPRRTQVLETRLRRIITLTEDPDLKAEAEGVLKSLRLFT